MLQSNQKTSLQVPFQLPEFIRDNQDYANFVAFVQAYYEWMEQSGGITDLSKNIPSNIDVDSTSSQFLEYFINDFLPYFPEDALISKQKAVRVARQLYQTKGTPASYQFLFRILYNSDFDYYNTGDSTLKASSGKWYVPKSLRIATDDTRFLQLNTNNFGNYRVFGETSKSFATIEYVTYSGTKTEIFISNIERLFQSGEIVRIVDSNLQDVIINGSNLTAKLVGQISQININPNNRGLFYAPGNPVIVYGGLSTDITNPIGATAEVGSVTSGSLQQINVVNGGYGYTASNTAIKFSNLNAGAISPIAIVGSVSTANEANVTLIVKDTIDLKQHLTIGNSNYYFANQAISNANTTLANAFTFLNFSTYSLSSVLVENGGGGLTTLPNIIADSEYPTDVSNIPGHLGNLGILGPIQILNAGSGYKVNDVIKFTGGSGYGAYANVTNVNTTGAIVTVSYVSNPTQLTQHYPAGGLGYTNSLLPTLTVNSSNTYAANAVLVVPGILGTGSVLSGSVDRAGSITTLNIIDPGEDYVETPNVSLKVQDILVSNVVITNLPQSGDIIYQGTSANVASYYSYFNSITLLSPNNDPTKSIWNMRVYNYSSQPSANNILKDSNNKTINMNFVNTTYAANYFNIGSPAYQNGVVNYGDGTALATATFMNGLAIGEGQYLDDTGQPSGFSILQSQNFNNFTYQITVSKEIQKYRDILLNLLHPSGMNLIGRYAIETNQQFDFHSDQGIDIAYPLYYYTQTAATTATLSATLSNPSTNTIQFNNLSGANLATILFANSSFIGLTSYEGKNLSSMITSVDYANNKATLQSSMWLAFANVAYVSTNANTNQINIENFTNAYYYQNNEIFLSSTPLEYMIFAGDTVTIGSNTYNVASVNAVSNIITTTSNIAYTTANSLLSFTRTYVAGGSLANATQIMIYNTIGSQYFPVITTENGQSITDESGNLILLG
jgi:hypothetical protein